MTDPHCAHGADQLPPHRHWQDAGYLIVYVTGRPDMQKHRVVAWLSQHNFPHGVVSFCDGLTHDPLRQKAMFLQSLMQEVSWGGSCPSLPQTRQWNHIWSHSIASICHGCIPGPLELSLWAKGR